MTDGITIDTSFLKRGLELDMQKMKANVDRTIRQIGGIMQDQARNHTPYVTGQLQRSVTHIERAEGDEYVAEVGTNLEYGPYVEFGTGDAGQWSVGYDYRGHRSDISYTQGWPGARARPYLRPALYDLEEMYVDLIRMALERSVA